MHASLCTKVIRKIRQLKTVYTEDDLIFKKCRYNIFIIKCRKVPTLRYSGRSVNYVTY